MLKKQHRLPSGQKLKNPFFLRTPYFKLKFSMNDFTTTRFGFVTSKALDRRAVVRNRAKRILRSCIEEMIDDIKAGYDMLFFPEKDIIDEDREKIFENLQRLLKENNLLNTNKK